MLLCSLGAEEALGHAGLSSAFLARLPIFVLELGWQFPKASVFFSTHFCLLTLPRGPLCPPPRQGSRSPSQQQMSSCCLLNIFNDLNEMVLFIP